MIGVGIIGAGLRGVYVLGARIAELSGAENATSLKIVGLCDSLESRANEGKIFLEKIYNDVNVTHSIWTTTSYQELIDHPDINFVIITTPTHVHKGPALYSLKSGKKTYLDKPISVTQSDSYAILKAQEESQNQLVMGLTRRYEYSWKKAFDMVQKGAIGNLRLIELRSIIPYTRYYHLWHRNILKSGGGFNDKCSHHFDVLNWFTQANPQFLHAIGRKSSLFKPDLTAPAHCRDCQRDCEYNIFKDQELQELGLDKLPPSWYLKDEDSCFDTCIYRPGSDQYDQVLCHVAYDNEIMASLNFCLYGPKSIDQETLELVGTRGRIRLTRSSGILDYVDHKGHQEMIQAQGDHFQSSHFGADIELVRHLESFFSGTRPVVSAKEGHLSLMMVQAACQSMGSYGKTVFLSEDIDEQFES